MAKVTQAAGNALGLLAIASIPILFALYVYITIKRENILDGETGENARRLRPG